MDIHETKRQISREYIGQGGIHGVGLSDDMQAIYIYTANVNAPVLKQIRERAQPFEVIIKGPEEQPYFTLM